MGERHEAVRRRYAQAARSIIDGGDAVHGWDAGVGFGSGLVRGLPHDLRHVTGCRHGGFVCRTGLPARDVRPLRWSALQGVASAR